ncbi:MAG: Maf family protein [Bauldia sp.]|nr:Maf family protein [Bauldia sp.]
MSAPRIILASGSAIRATILANAGVDFEAIPAPVDEREIESGLVAEGASPEDVALALAEAKARAIAAANPSAFVIGADQTLDAGGDRWHKPGTRLEARAQLLALSGRSHRLHAAVVGAHGGEVRWRHVGTAAMTMRHLLPVQIDDYLDRAGEAALQSVGAYQVEGLGIRLFERIDGDYFAILGLPILPLLAWLRHEGVMD